MVHRPSFDDNYGSRFFGSTQFRAIVQWQKICSQDPGTFAIQLFCTHLFINLLLFIKCVSRSLETKLKQGLPSSFNSAIGQKSEMLCSVESLTVGIQISLALSHWSVIMPLFIQERKILKRNLFILGHFFWTL